MTVLEHQWFQETYPHPGSTRLSLLTEFKRANDFVAAVRQERRTVMLVNQPLGASDLDSACRSTTPLRLHVNVARTHVRSDPTAILQVTGTSYTVDFNIENIDPSHSGYVGTTVTGGQKIFFIKKNGHWLIYPRA